MKLLFFEDDINCRLIFNYWSDKILSMRMRIGRSIKQSPNQWMVGGGLTLFILFLVISLNGGFSFFYLLLFGLLGAIGVVAIKPQTTRPKVEPKVEESVDENVLELMNQVQARC
ncbi:MAG: hypothetical protein PHV66_06425, partial [Bacteroidales bacterium]|nr:hypothetical protein [Bacteroidales bacterium]